MDVVDERGRVVPDTAVPIEVTLRGPATLVGFGSASTLAKGSFQSSQAETFCGRALAILKSEGRSGLIDIEARSDGLPMRSLQLRLI